MSEHATLQEKELDLFQDDVGRGQKPPGRSGLRRKLLIAGVAVAAGGAAGYLAHNHFSGPDAYKSRMKERAPVVETVNEAPKPAVPGKLRDSYAAAMEKSNDAVESDHWDGKYPSREFLEKWLYNYFNHNSDDNFYFHGAKILSVGPAEKYGDILVKFRAEYDYNGKKKGEEVQMVLEYKRGKWRFGAFVGGRGY